MQPTPLSPLITPPPPRPRQSKRLLYALGGGLTLAGVVFILLKMGGKPALPPRDALRDRPPSEQSMVGAPAPPPDDVRLPTSYARHALPTVPRPVQASQPPWRPGAPAPPGDLRPPPGQPPATSANGAAPPPHRAAVTTKTVATTTTTRKEAPPRWFSTPPPPQGDVLAPPFAPDPKDEDAQAKGSKLFPAAVWERPVDPTRVLYADQLVYGQLAQAINSDIPGTVRIKVTQHVEDRWGQGQVLLPVDTVLLGHQDGSAKFGQSRLPVTITMGILPSGAAIQWNNGQVGDATGAAGVPMKVDAHLGKVIVGVGLSAILSIGARAPFGNTQGYQPSLPQEFAEDVSRDLNRSGQEIIKRQLMVNPTLTQKFAYPVTIQFKENVSFQTPATIVHK